MDEGECDIYADLPKFRYDDALDKLQASNRKLSEEINQLNEKLIMLSKEKEECQSKCATLSKNISSLLKTAQAEIKRKDKLIKDLRISIAKSKVSDSKLRKRKLRHEESPCKTKRNRFKEDTLCKEELSNDFVNNPEEKSFLLNNVIQDFQCSDNKKTDTNLVLTQGTGSMTGSRREACKTLYSQRMLDKMHATNVQERIKLTEVVSEKEVTPGLDRINDCTGENSTKVSGKMEEVPEDIDKMKYIFSDHPLMNVVNLPARDVTNTHLSNNQLTLRLDESNKKANDEIFDRNERTHQSVSGAKFSSFQKNESSNSLKVTNTSTFQAVSDNQFTGNLGVKRVDNKEFRDKGNNLYEKQLKSGKEKSPPTEQNKKESTHQFSGNDAKNDSSKFLRPNSSSVIKRLNKKIIHPVCKCWSGLVKTVESVSYRKGCEGFCNQENNQNSNVEIKNDVPSIILGNKETTELGESGAKNPEPNENPLMDQLFGSPLKWTDNSDESSPPIDLTSPALYEDSCSAHIENVTFKKANSSFHKPDYVVKNTLCTKPTEKQNSINYKNENEPTHLKNPLDKGNLTGNVNTSIRAFEEIGGANTSRLKSIFSPLKSDSCKSVNSLNKKEISLDLSFNFPLKSRFEDSVLGQFDDTTQFVSALTRIESKISPINTPIKTVPAPTSLALPTESEIEKKTCSQMANKTATSEFKSLSSLSNKNLNEKPINILYPRKTPRIVSYNKPKEEKPDMKPTSAPNDTPTKCNRFAINDAFISQQEKKVMRISKNNINDPIAITITAKSKTKGKDNSLPNQQGKLSFSPKKTKVVSPAKKKIESPESLTKKRGLSKEVPRRNVSLVKRNLNENNNRSSEFLKGTVFNEMKKEGNVGEVEASAEVQPCNPKLPQEERLNGLNAVHESAIHSFCIKRKSFEQNLVEEEGISVNKQGNSDLLLRVPNINTGKDYLEIHKYQENKKEGSDNFSIDKKNPPENFNVSSFPNQDKCLKNSDNHSQIMSPSKLILKKNLDSLRNQNFKPSSQLKYSKIITKTRETKNANKSASPKNHLHDYNSAEHLEIIQRIEGAPQNHKRSIETSSIQECQEKLYHIQQYCGSDDFQKSSNVIIRSSKKPKFVSTTLLDEEYGKTNFKKSTNTNGAGKCSKVTEIEWVLKPITFDTSRTCSYVRNQNCSRIQEVPKYLGNEEKSRFPLLNKNEDNPLHSNYPASRKYKLNNVVRTGDSFHKVISGRRPLNFGVRESLD